MQHHPEPPPRALRARDRLPFAAGLGTEGAPFPARGARIPRRPCLNETPWFSVTTGYTDQAVGAAPPNPQPDPLRPEPSVPASAPILHA